MIRAAIVGLGWWGETLVEAVQDSPEIRFVAGATRTVSPEVKTFAANQTSLNLAENYDALLADSDDRCRRARDAALAARAAGDGRAAAAGSTCSARSRSR